MNRHRDKDLAPYLPSQSHHASLTDQLRNFMGVLERTEHYGQVPPPVYSVEILAQDQEPKTVLRRTVISILIAHAEKKFDELGSVFALHQLNQLLMDGMAHIVGRD
jgi:hypothetical protein